MHHIPSDFKQREEKTPGGTLGIFEWGCTKGTLNPFLQSMPCSALCNPILD